MMDANTYLTRLYNKVKITDGEIADANKSLEYLRTKLWGDLQGGIEKVEIFGAFSRRSALSPEIDKHSDVDVFVLFKDNSLQPQTYLNKVKAVVETHYQRSEIFQDHPTIVIQLQHLRFEVLPATGRNDDLKIPASRSTNETWIATSPQKQMDTLKEKNDEYNNMITPLVIIFKYWNSLSGYPFESHFLENFAITHSYGSYKILKDFVYEMISDLYSNKSRMSDSQKELVNSLYEKRRRLKVLEEYNIPEYIEQELASFLPFPQVMAAAVKN